MSEVDEMRKRRRGFYNAGVVTSINKDLLYFEINKLRIYMIRLFLENKEQKLPNIGTHMKINVFPNVLRSNCVLLTSDNEIEGDCSVAVERESHQFLNLVITLKLTPSDLADIIINHQRLKKDFHSSNKSFNSEQIICSLISTLKGIQKIQLLSECLFLDVDVNVFKDYGYWTWGNHWIGKEKLKPQILLGFVCLHSANGMILFTDFKRSVPCLVTNTTPINLGALINKFVVVKECVYITEIYNSKAAVFSEYILVDFEEIIILNLPYEEKKINSSTEIEYESDHFTLISKSLPTANRYNKIDLWLEVKYVNNKSNELLCLNASSASYALLLENSCYEVLQQQKLRPVKYHHMQYFKANLPQNEAIGGTKLEFVFDFGRKDLMDTISAHQQLIQNSRNIISFQGKIKFKKFVDPLSSRTPKYSNDPAFGTPGYKTHLLEFDAGAAALTVYLNNWENTLIPYGLIPNMVVNVKNVEPQKGRYYKSTAMTQFEIVRYEPAAKFNTVSELGAIRFYYLGAGKKIPDGVIIWGRTILYSVLNLKILPKGQILEVSITLTVRDDMGISKVTAQNKPAVLLLQLLLPSLNLMSVDFKSVGSVVFEHGQKIEGVFDPNNVKHMLLHHFPLIAERGPPLKLKCRKINMDMSGKPVYVLMDAVKYLRFV